MKVKRQSKSLLVEQFSRVRVMVVGDIMLDSYTLGVVERLSVEAPVPVVLTQGWRHVLGGAGNVARNVAALGANVVLIGVVGDDEAGGAVRALGEEFKINTTGIIIDGSRPTTVKNRIVVGHHQVLRIDQESKVPVSPGVEKKLVAALRATDADVVIFSDYAKGVVTRNLVAAALKKFGALCVLADFKPSQASYYRNVGFVFPNLKEAGELTGIHASTKSLAKEVAELLAKRFNASVILKRSEYGMTLFAKGKKGIMHIPTQAREVFDVTGAGDTVIATMAVALAAGIPFIQAGIIANHAAGIVVEMEGTAVPDIAELVKRAGL